jgi:hypothetical protein
MHAQTSAENQARAIRFQAQIVPRPGIDLFDPGLVAQKQRTMSHQASQAYWCAAPARRLCHCRSKPITELWTSATARLNAACSIEIVMAHLFCSIGLHLRLASTVTAGACSSSWRTGFLRCRQELRHDANRTKTE